MKKIFLILLFEAIIWGASYDLFLLDTQLSLLPKIAILEKNFIAPTKGPIKMLIVYDSNDEETALFCSNTIQKKFAGNLNNRPFQVTLHPFDKLDNNVNYQIIFILKTTPLQMKKVQNIISLSKAVTAIYDADSIGDSGALLSIRMERNPVILINARTLRESHFSFPDSLFEISRIVQ